MSRGGARITWTSTLLRDVIVSSKCTRRDMNVSVVKPSHVAAPALKQEPFGLLRFHFGVSEMPLRVTWTYERTFHCQSFVALCSLSLYLVVSFLPHAVNCGRFRFWRRQSVFLFVYEKSREPQNGFAPNSHGRRVWSLARTSLKVRSKVKVTRDKKRHSVAVSAACVVYVW